MTPLTLVAGGSAAAREAAIAAALDPRQASAVILEGLPDGTGKLESLQHPTLQIIRIAPGCVCCTGNTVLRVTLNRILRRPPAHIYVGLATTGHLARVQAFLRAAPYDGLLELQAGLQL